MIEVERGGYPDAILLDMDGNIIAPASSRPESIRPLEKTAIDAAATSSLPTLGDLYRNKNDAIFINAVALGLATGRQALSMVLNTSPMTKASDTIDALTKRTFTL